IDVSERELTAGIDHEPVFSGAEATNAIHLFQSEANRVEVGMAVWRSWPRRRVPSTSAAWSASGRGLRSGFVRSPPARSPGVPALLRTGAAGARKGRARWAPNADSRRDGSRALATTTRPLDAW